MTRKLLVSLACVLVVVPAAAAQEGPGAAEAYVLAETYVPAEAHFAPGLIDWAALYANPAVELEPVGFGTVAVERRSFERSVASLVLMAVAAYGVYAGLSSRAGGSGWGRALAVAAPSGIGVAAGVHGFTRWSKVPAVRRVGW